MSVADLVLVAVGVVAAVAVVWCAVDVVVGVRRWIRSRCGTEAPEAPSGMEHVRHLYGWPALLEGELRARAEESGESECFIGTDAAGDPFIVHGAWLPRTAGDYDDRFEVWIFDASDDQVSLLDIAFPVTGFYTADLEPEAVT